MASFLVHSLASSLDVGLLLAVSAQRVARYQIFLPWVVAAVIIVAGLFVYGWSDLVRTRWRRIWALSSVCQTEAVRKRILWITPLAMLGVIVVTQFYHPAGEQETIRQTTKFCLFASALIVTLTAVVLACTSLPREIESRVIYTIVTKPTTRLEIVIGKVLGFARVSGLIILVMGIFTYIYLQTRTGPMLAQLRDTMAHLPADSPRLASDRYYLESGLLGTRSLDFSDDMQIYSRAPDNTDERWMAGGQAQYCLIPFDMTQNEREAMYAAADKGVPVQFQFAADISQVDPDEQQRKEATEMGLAPAAKLKAHEVLGPSLPTTEPTTGPAEKAPPLIPQISVQFLDADGRVLTGGKSESGALVELKATPGQAGAQYSGTLQLPTQALQTLAHIGRFLVQVAARTPATEFGIGPQAASFSFPGQDQAQFPPIVCAKDPNDPTRSLLPQLSAYPARHGRRLGPVDKKVGGPMAVFSFHGTPIVPGKNGKVGLQVSVSIERVGDFTLDPDHAIGYSTASVEVRNHDPKIGSSGQVQFVPETSQSEPVAIDAKYFEGGNFDVLLRNTTPGQYLGVQGGQTGGVAVVAADRSFAFNLFKSLFILWLLSILVVIIAIFCSTFLSWPIAMVLTLMILMGHWGVEQLGDALKPGAARNMATTFNLRDPATLTVFTTSVDNLSAVLRHLSDILPDVSRFAVTEDIERGVSIPAAKIGQSLGVIFCYGLPMLVFSYVILRLKEVAP